MRKHAPSAASAMRAPRLLAALSLATAACTDGTAPLAPAKPPDVVPIAEASPDIYPGTTNTEFFDVKTGSSGMGISIMFDYAGAVTPAFTVGKGPDVLATQIKSVATKKQAAGYWTGTVSGLTPATQYWFRLDNLKSTWYGTIKTQRRQVLVDLDSVKVLSDGDWGWNCGDLIQESLVTDNPWAWYNPDRTYQLHGGGIHCVHSGGMLRFPGQRDDGTHYDLGTKRISSWTAGDTAHVWHRLHDTDQCTHFEVKCGPTAQSYWTAVPVRNSGTYKFVTHTQREDKAFDETPVNAIWYWRVIVSYHNADSFY